MSAVSSDPAAATVSPGSLTFTSGNWETAQEFTVTGVASSDTKGDTATITNTARSVEATTRGCFGKCIGDGTDDAYGAGFSKDAVTVTEASGAGHTDTYTVRLKIQPTGTVTVAVASSSTGCCNGESCESLTFTTEQLVDGADSDRHRHRRLQDQ